MKKFEILIVDDSPISRAKVMKMIQNNFNVKIWEASNAMEGMRLLGNHNIDLILLDVIMPDIDGFKAARVIRTHTKTANIPIIFVTGSDPKKQKEYQGFESGGIDYITKPFTEKEMTRLLSLYMRFIRREQEMNKILADNNEKLKAEIEERILAEAELSKREQELQDSNRTKDKFFSIIAHDLKNPIGTFRNVLSVLVEQYEEFAPEERREFLEMLNDSSKNLYELLENLLDWSRAQTGGLQFNPEATPLNFIATSACQPLEMIATNKNIDLEVEVDEDIEVMADTNLIVTVIRNLVANSIKFTPEGGSIKVYNIQKDDRSIIKIKDSGVGISEENIQKLFRIDVSHSTMGTNDEKGTGLGLILCKEFIEKHDGSIEVESTEGKGTTFSFDLETVQKEIDIDL